MADKKKQSKKGKPAKRSGRPTDRITVRRVPGSKIFELVDPPCVRQRAEDMEEVRTMLAAGEIEVAMDELRWLLGGCQALLEAHQLLGQVALDAGETDLARSHFGHAFELGTKALPSRGLAGTLPFARRANQPFLKSAAALAKCFTQLGDAKMAAEVTQQLLALDPTDPLDVKGLGEETG